MKLKITIFLFSSIVLLLIYGTMYFVLRDYDCGVGKNNSYLATFSYGNHEFRRIYALDKNGQELFLEQHIKNSFHSDDDWVVVYGEESKYRFFYFAEKSELLIRKFKF